ncbi:MAG: KamA family radical SAM protein [Bacteroidia bacterium]
MSNKAYKAFSLHNITNSKHYEFLKPSTKEAIQVVGNVLPFKTNNYVIDELINWGHPEKDPMFLLTFPHKDMLLAHHYTMMHETLLRTNDKQIIKDVANKIRLTLNPHPAGQMEKNVPKLYGKKLTGIQHKYRETVLFFPSQGQTCHAYCTFCFRWPQFSGLDEYKFAMRDAEILVDYIKVHPEITDILFTGGDPMIMKTRIFAAYIDTILNASIPHLKTIRIGTKALAYWPYRFTIDDDAFDLLELFKKINRSGLHLSLMAHFSHPVELKTDAVKEAVANIRATGTVVRTQSPVLKGINDHSDIWAEMWRLQVNMGMIPYYMFIPRDTGAQDFFAVTLARAWKIFRNATSKVSGIARTVRGPSMSCTPGKVQVSGIADIGKEKVFVLNMLQGRNPDWTGRPFFAKYNQDAIWIDDLEPALNHDKFFFENENEQNDIKKLAV